MSATADEGPLYPRAFADREKIFDYLHQRSPSGAQDVMTSIQESAAQLGEQPHSGYRTEMSGVFVKFVVRYSYKIFYRVREEAVELVHIRHTARHPWRND
ncbi:MAG: type II toxin-antitoxin system RelE/ParE family toxin [Xanthobacteraceae bacterium]